MFLSVFALFPLLAGAESSRGQRVRKLHMKPDDIALVHTAVGIATIIQVPDRPTSVVLGDTNVFKVEYLDTAITIKPLSHSAKSNLYVYTEARRFSVSLVTSPQVNADYIVYLYSENQLPSPPKERWRKLGSEKHGGDIKLVVRRLGTIENYLAIDFALSSKKDISFGPEWIWVTQGGKTIPIQSLNLSGVRLSSKNDIQGGLTIRREDLLGHEALVLEVRSPTPFVMKLPGVSSWMK